MVKLKRILRLILICHRAFLTGLDWILYADVEIYHYQLFEKKKTDETQERQEKKELNIKELEFFSFNTFNN